LMIYSISLILSKLLRTKAIPSSSWLNYYLLFSLKSLILASMLSVSSKSTVDFFLPAKNDLLE
jgi:hypothetical protein